MTINPKQARLTLGLNQTEMAKAMGIHRNHWLKFERGERNLTAAPSRLLECLLWLKSIGRFNEYSKIFNSAGKTPRY